jgi:hypothetical protein
VRRLKEVDAVRPIVIETSPGNVAIKTAYMDLLDRRTQRRAVYKPSPGERKSKYGYGVLEYGKGKFARRTQTLKGMRE